MYTQSSCSERNSSTPITQAQINVQNLRMNRIVQPMLDGNSDMGALIASLTPPPATNTCDDFKTSLSLGPAYPWPLPGWQNPSGGPMPTTAGAIAAAASTAAAASSAGSTAAAAGIAPAAATPAVSVPVSGAAPTPSGSPSTISPGGPGWVQGRGNRGAQFGRGGNGRGRFGNPYFTHANVVDSLNALMPPFACSGPAKVIAVPVLATPKTVSATPDAAGNGSCPPQSSCMSGNICLDIKRGCVSSSQVDPAQLQACAEAGYQGVESFFPCVLANPNVLSKNYGTPNPNPPQYSTVMSQDVPPSNEAAYKVGVSGLGCGGDGGPGTLTGVLGIALGVAAGLFFAGWILEQQRIAA